MGMDFSRYVRQMILPGFGQRTQEKLAAARVLIIGAGGLGAPVLQYLGAAGIGRLGIVDHDRVSESNLHRQVIYKESDIGEQKAVIARERLLELNSSLIVDAISEELNKDNGPGLIASYDIVVDATDNFETRYLVNDLCYLYQKPLVYASLYRYQGQLAVFHYGERSANLRELFPRIPDPSTVASCTDVGVLGAMTGIMGSLQALEVIKIIGGVGDVLSGELLVLDSLNCDTQKLAFSASNDIFRPLDVSEILSEQYVFHCAPTDQLYDLVQLSTLVGEGAMVVDVRGPDERPRISMFPVIEIPLPQLESRLDELKDPPVLIFLCQSGVRSLQAIDTVKQFFPGKQYYNVAGGIKIMG